MRGEEHHGNKPPQLARGEVTHGEKQPDYAGSCPYSARIGAMRARYIYAKKPLIFYSKSIFVNNLMKMHVIVDTLKVF